MKGRVQKWIPREYAELADDIARHINERIQKGELIDKYEAGVKGSTIIARALGKGLLLIMEEVGYQGRVKTDNNREGEDPMGSQASKKEKSFLDDLWRG